MAKIDDVARLAGVSKGTVSNVFSQKRPTSKTVREKVLQVSRELNYVPNHIARSLVTKKTMAIGLTIPHGNFFFSVFHNQFINGVVLEASIYGYRVLLDMIPVEEVKTPSLASYPIDGAIVLGPTEEDERIDLLHQNQVPFVTVGKIINEGLYDATTVNNDNDQIMRDICDYLVGFGHRNMMFLNAGRHSTVSIERTEGFVRALQEHEIELQPHMVHYKPGIHSDQYMTYGYDETIRILGERKERVTAIIADDDRTAFSVMNAINELGYSVPDDISLFVICGDLSMMHQVTPSLTGMDLQPSELGAQSVKQLMHKLGVLEGEYPDNCIVSSTIIERSSCSPVYSRNESVST
ncbi:LacI family DNA-binding transcriptional regulator [Paenibacillus radicis (ex Gao et al. 2016)]|uniref:LacI family transcriptional regulator n=1 Tax=Paenibacillus radicis (ex Gao et al. 2016) TaxID=1737354 RepID=A0A917GW72_9BACL|nr:LacI family DNA-binding transcriptional regulator [Paenibacillus radicis (ex Gao et al. 2016)]GGG59238.1 LacI family transcriptional regulator [Paenibacillus radicis (ex Gao et al. 2016)]